MGLRSALLLAVSLVSPNTYADADSHIYLAEMKCHERVANQAATGWSTPLNKLPAGFKIVFDFSGIELGQSRTAFQNGKQLSHPDSITEEPRVFDPRKFHGTFFPHRTAPFTFTVSSTLKPEVRNRFGEELRTDQLGVTLWGEGETFVSIQAEDSDARFLFGNQVPSGPFGALSKLLTSHDLHEGQLPTLADLKRAFGKHVSIPELP